jgi:hypothetical protein
MLAFKGRVKIFLPGKRHYSQITCIKGDSLKKDLAIETPMGAPAP